MASLAIVQRRAADRLGPGKAERAGLELAGDERAADERADEQRQEHEEARQVQAEAQVLVLEGLGQRDGVCAGGGLRVAQSEAAVDGVHAEALHHQKDRDAHQQNGDPDQGRAMLPPGHAGQAGDARPRRGGRPCRRGLVEGRRAHEATSCQRLVERGRPWQGARRRIAQVGKDQLFECHGLFVPACRGGVGPSAVDAHQQVGLAFGEALADDRVTILDALLLGDGPDQDAVTRRAGRRRRRPPGPVPASAL